MPIEFKQKCQKCKTNYVLATKRSRYIVCYDCQKKEITGEIEDSEMKKLFDIPEEFYKQNMFLRDIKIKYLKFGNLSENQINAFKKTVNELNEIKKSKEA